MRLRWAGILAAAAALAVTGTVAATAVAVPAVPTAALVGWGLAKAITTPGINDATIGELSCAGAGDCVAGGSGLSSGPIEAFLATEKNGTWGRGTPVPGLAALSANYTSVDAVSCFSPGNCAAGGAYEGTGGAFLIDEVNGAWSDAAEVPGLTALAASGADIVALSCPGAGDCAAAGTATNADDNPLVFVAQEKGRTWSDASELPGFAALDALPGNRVDVYLSCPSNGNCTAVGTYVTTGDYYESFVSAERNGSWSAAKPVTDIQFDTLSCSSAGDCVAAGDLRTGSASGAQAGFLTEKSGIWSKPAQTPGITAFKGEKFAGAAGAACPAAGDCTIVGTYYTSEGTSSAFIDTQTNGRWGRAEQVPGLAALSVQGVATGLAIGCASAGNCSVGGSYAYATWELPYLAQQTGGAWASAQTVAGLGAIGGDPQEATTAISCASPRGCTAAGVFSPASTDRLAPFAVGQVPLRPAVAVLALTTGRAVYGNEQTVQAAVAVSAAAGTATGTVTVRSGTRIGCTITLSGGAGTCRLAATGFPAGDDRLTAAYGGGTGLASSVSAPRALAVAKAATSTRLKLSASTVTFGDEQAERLTVTVSPRYAGTAAGRVTVKASSVTVCVITLKSSRTGHCTLSPKKLGLGTYHLVARYPGSADFTASASAKETLTVVR